MKTYFVADPHFGDDDIRRMENRPFASVAEMDAALIQNWNRVVGKNDRVFLLGDLSFYGNATTAEIVGQLQGVKNLIMGNHDEQDIRVYYDMGFHRVYDAPMILDGFWILSHEPQPYMNDHMPYANIFGHVHGNKVYTSHSGYSFCVCVERIGYTPIEFGQIKRHVGTGSRRPILIQK